MGMLAHLETSLSHYGATGSMIALVLIVRIAEEGQLIMLF
jgi:hypothetical protein